MEPTDRLKREAANAAVDRFVESGATLGLGSGTTSAFVVQRIGEKLAAGELRGVRGVPTSEGTAALAREAGIPLVGLSEARPTLTLDGADEIGPRLATIKGLGGALLREKIVAAASLDGLVLVADGSKAVDTLGTRGPLPVEVDPFGWEATFEALASLGCEPRLRMDRAEPGRPFVTDGGHYTADCAFGPIQDPPTLEAAIKNIPGALECGLFIGLARAAVIADQNGVRTIET
ncbi:ribose-5-phosphate isomerase RpiA [Rubrobacter tropicus]|uniref:Ribose-5-phosphate isomerase A n=1 Tax=Rubrobacter tropicus TaxID=2653851 RepID=A0A6G8QBH2_9ACTN|nr:ribose-5-phosphate isomerase RpiA [Rubrobacter tropicus]QIN83791.1 ribose-5-phosphate isomerase RpiA [Rubrobacter tropicus]